MINLHKCTDKERVGEENVFFTIGFNIIRDAGVPDPAALGIVTAMGQLMSTTDRFYHTLVHINDIFRVVGAKKINLTDAERLAIYFHDAIYVVGQTPESEIQSANLMKSLLSAYPVNRNVIKDAEEMILATAKHLEDVPDNRVHRVLDLDIAGLGTQPHEYASRSELIGLEIGTANNAKRVEFLKRFLAKSKLYYIFGELEIEARTNMRREISSLGGQ
jgi:predicted metal-dependent HD superfamily phosphohydrolase